MQSESPDCDMPDAAAVTAATTADRNADYNTPDELVVNTLAKANSCTAHTAAEEKAATRETADTPQAQTATAITADSKADCDTPGKLDVNTLAKAS